VFPLKDNIPTDRYPAVTVALIVANVLMYFLFQKGGLTLGDPSSRDYLCNLVDYAAVPRELTDPDFHLQAQECASNADPSPWLTPLTSMFMHGGLLHLGGNMLFLWIFGNNVEDSMGPVKFIVFYLLGGVAALALQVAIDPDSAVPTVGASGAIAGVLGGYLLLFPRARVLTAIVLIFFFTLIEIPAIFVLGFWFIQQVAFGYFDLSDPTGGEGGVAYFAHIGGFVFGLIAIKLFANRKREEQAWLGG
jgi:membrane associated rhomboid family serine protease